MLSQEIIDDLEEFAEKLVAEQEKESIKNSPKNKRGQIKLTSEANSLNNLPVAASYNPSVSYVAKSK